MTADDIKNLLRVRADQWRARCDDADKLGERAPSVMGHTLDGMFSRVMELETLLTIIAESEVGIDE